MDEVFKAQAGERITQFFIIRSIEYRTGKSSGGGYIAVEFGYREGRIAGNIWRDAEAAIKEYTAGDIVKVRGTVDIYKDKKRISVEKIRKIREGDNIDRMDLIPSYEGDQEKLKNDLKGIIKGVKNPLLKKLLESFFKDREFTDNFNLAPGGILPDSRRKASLSLYQTCLPSGLGIIDMANSAFL